MTSHEQNDTNGTDEVNGTIGTAAGSSGLGDSVTEAHGFKDLQPQSKPVSRPDSPKDYKNLSINSILNVRGNPAQQNSQNGHNRLSSIGSVIAYTRPQGSHENPIKEPSEQQQRVFSPVTSSQNPSPPSNPYEAYPQQFHHQPQVLQPLHVHRGSLPPGAPAVYNQYGQLPPSGSGQSSAGVPVSLENNQLHHQMHSAQDMDPLHESKRGRRFRRRYNQILRRYNCSYPGCVKSYGSLNHLNTHIVTKKHGNRRSKTDFQHNQLPSGESENSLHQGHPYRDPHHFPPQPMGHPEYTSGNYWYGYRPPSANSIHVPGSPIPFPHPHQGPVPDPYANGPPTHPYPGPVIYCPPGHAPPPPPVAPPAQFWQQQPMYQHHQNPQYAPAPVKSAQPPLQSDPQPKSEHTSPTTK